MNKFSLYSAVSACAFTLVAGASQAFSDPILTEDIIGGAPGGMMQRALDEQIYDSLELRRMNYEKLKTPEDIKT